jgi:hypothetical protein
MGFFKDMQRARTASNQANAAMGRPTTTLGRLGNIGNDMRYAADQAEWAADQFARANEPDAPVSGGVPGVATIHTPKATGQMDGFMQVFELTLDIEAEGRVPEQVVSYQRVPSEGLVMMMPGRRLRVLVDPNDPRNLNVDWHGSLAGGF